MPQPETTTERASLLGHWKPDMPDAERRRLLAAYQANRSCCDCRFWDHETEDDPTQGACGTPAARGVGFVLAPADWTCDEWEERANAEA